MKHILQSLKTGTTEIADVPVPSSKPYHLLIKSSRTLVSAGTERMLVEFGKSGLINKARQQPDKVKMVLDKIKTDGLFPTIEAVFNKLDQPLPLGYCNVGQVEEVGEGVIGFKKGDRVVSNGKHAEIVRVPINLCARVPDNVTDEEASFVVLAAIALQSIRLVNPTLGETVVVTGLGLIGLLTVMLLQAHGCRVLGMDFDQKRLDLAKQLGAEVINLSVAQDPIASAYSFTRGRGVDAVIISASTKSNEPIQQAAKMCRQRGRIVLVGVCGLELLRSDFYEKELTFQVSCSYGPGRYDVNYEEKGNDYPVGFVRWTEQRNFEAVLDMMAEGRIDVKPLISHRFDISKAQEAYELIVGKEPALGILLEYPGMEITLDSKYVQLEHQDKNNSLSQSDEKNTSISFIGAGNYATAVLIPAFKVVNASLQTIVSSEGVSGLHAGRKFGFKETTTDVDAVFNDDGAKTIVVTTRHDTHAHFVLRALKSGKNIFVEKPLCITKDQLLAIEKKYNDMDPESRPFIMVGFNRRFSPQIQKIKKLLSKAVGPKSFIMTVNAGKIPGNHWTQNKNVGGGRIIGEACHFIDLLRFLADSPIVKWQHLTMNATTKDTVSLQLSFSDGSIGTIHYFANGSSAFPKERLEVFASGGILQLDNFRKLSGYGWSGFKKMNLWRQDKGQKSCVKAFTEAVKNNEKNLIPFDELLEVARISIDIEECIH
jgi:threonine dehydrogenase-like Zn-dependent dehydrogenase/predicted dehydrogenase